MSPRASPRYLGSVYYYVIQRGPGDPAYPFLLSPIHHWVRNEAPTPKEHTPTSTTASRPAPKNKLKSAWELIFAKYEQDTSDYADEIDLETGEIVVDKSRSSGLTLALNILDINTSTSAAPQVSAGLPAR